MNYAKTALRALLTASVFVMIGCQSNQALVKPCCYLGNLRSVHFTDLQFALADGHTVPFSSLFPGFELSHAAVLRAPPVLENFYIDRVAYVPLARALMSHDGNGDGRLEDPEMTKFYLWESARGLGHDIVEIRAHGVAVRAIQSSVADFGSLLNYLSDNQARFDKNTVALFRLLEAEAIEQRIMDSDAHGGLPSS
ncbi:MAG: hypothetical protein ACI8PT_003650 [Gammaproteobacteria bacterium]|jgi:hypothetical protein